MKKTFNALTVLAILAVSSASAEDNTVVYADVAGGNAGAAAGVTVVTPLVPSTLALTLGVTGGVDKENGKIVPNVTGAAGLKVSLEDRFHLIPKILYKCESSTGCGPRAGGEILLGDEFGFQLGGAYSRAITNVDHGEKNDYSIFLRVPLSSNEEDRNLNSKGDMDFNDNSRKNPKAPSAANA